MSVAPDQDSWDRYGRRLFFVWTSDGRLLNYDLVADGYAEAIRVRPNDTYWPLLRQTGEQARIRSPRSAGSATEAKQSLGTVTR